MSPVNLWYLIVHVFMVISRIIALVYDPVKSCCFNSQVIIYLDVFQLSKTVFLLARFCSNKLFISADKGCLILVRHAPTSFDLAIFISLTVKYRIFCPMSAKMQVEGFHFFILSPANTVHFSRVRSFSLTKPQILALEGMMNA